VRPIVSRHDTEAPNRLGLRSANLARVRCVKWRRACSVASRSRNRTSEGSCDFCSRSILGRSSDIYPLVTSKSWIDSAGGAITRRADLAAESRSWVVLGSSFVSSIGTTMTANKSAAGKRGIRALFHTGCLFPALPERRRWADGFCRG